jgi:RING finger protein 113A
MDEGDQNDVVEFKRPRKRGNIRKRDESDDGGAVADSTEDVDTVVVSQPKRQKTGVTTSSTKSSSSTKEDVTNFTFSSAGAETFSSKDNSIFGTLQTETERDRDAIAISERNKRLQEQSETDGKDMYRGMGGYKQYVPTKTAGPLRTTTHVRMSVLFDYQPDICKDYKETGYCGYGDKYENIFFDFLPSL